MGSKKSRADEEWERRHRWDNYLIGAGFLATAVFLAAVLECDRRQGQREARVDPDTASMGTPAMLPATEVVVSPTVTVPVDIYDRSLGKVVVEVSVYGKELLVSSRVLDSGPAEGQMLCLKGGSGVGLVDPDRPFPQYAPERGQLLCASRPAGEMGEPLVVKLINLTGAERAALVVAGLVQTHQALKGPGDGARNSYWDCDVRPGTALEGMEGSTVGLWPRPIQDCTEYVMGLSGPVYDRDCPPPCP